MATQLQDLLPILAQIAQERDRSVSLSELAEQAARSPSYFQRAFGRIVGESPKQFDKRLRLECGAVMLLTGERSVLDVALEAGFASHEGFTRAFSSHFGLSPKDFRSRGAPGGPDALALHADLVQHVGPCVGLFRAPLVGPTKSFKGKKQMSYDITQKQLEEQTVLYIEAKCEQSEIAQALGNCLPAVYGYAAKSGITMMGPPYARYPSWGPGLITIQGGMPVAPGSKGEGDIKLGKLPAGKAAVTIHTGPYDGLGDAHHAVQKWLDDNGFKHGAPWEVYLTDPGEVPNPEEWKTEVVWPILES